jgi:hypothetical protein
LAQFSHAAIAFSAYFHTCVLITTELPKPDLGDITDMKASSIQVQKKKNPAILGLKYEQLVAMDTISVDLVPEKKGILLKHNEYSVHSQVGLNILLDHFTQVLFIVGKRH